MTNQSQSAQAPIMDALLRYREAGRASFHVPGHKNGQLYRQDEIASLLQDVMSIDVTEITGMDDLHHPEDMILEAQQLAADCFGAEESFFLVGGSTAGNLALILTVCSEPGDILLVQRNVHKSVLHGLMLAGARAVFLEPYIDPISQLASAPVDSTIRSALAAYPEAKGVLITVPNYYGMGLDITAIAEICHEVGVPLLVDEAHGAHYGLHPQLPASALASGADGVVQSTHKMLSAMTMGAMLHIQGEWIDRELLRQRLAMLQSSSPSYPIMASLDLARRYVHIHREQAFREGMEAIRVFREGWAGLTRFRLLGPAEVNSTPPIPQLGEASKAEVQESESILDSNPGYSTQDPFKIVICDRYGVWSGYELQEKLEQQGCIPEMSTERYVVLLFTLASVKKDAVRLLQALEYLEKESTILLSVDVLSEGLHKDNHEVSTWNNLRALKYSQPVRFHLQPPKKDQVETVSLELCDGRVAAEMVIPYPPGIPLLYPGETIQADIVERLMKLQSTGAKCQGVADPSMRTIRVYRDRITSTDA